MDEELLKSLVHNDIFSTEEKILFCIAFNDNSPKKIKELKTIFENIGYNYYKDRGDLNLTRILNKLYPKVIRTNQGYELGPKGKQLVEKYVINEDNSPLNNTSETLRNALIKIQDVEIRNFVAESIECVERRLYRAAIVLSWVGAVSVLQEYVIKNKLAEFNKEAKRRNAKWKNAKKRTDLGRMKEYEFLQVLESISVIGKNVKQQLEYRLQLRNACGHPSSLDISDNIVASHIEVLILNVFTKYLI